ncbi:phospholipase D family protein [Tepidibacter mesophilus]|uniref:phospholipase D family protein n=1 Tax=Tepidibacter mesophilus TaxID=655607 RepID=UPI001FA8E964|nr:phospholipase D family protein [Tepidibacter mesophilus]
MSSNKSNIIFISKNPKKKYFTVKNIAIMLAIVTVVNGFITPMPKGLSFEGELHNVSDIEFLYDLTYKKDGEVIHEQSIFEKQLELIKNAKEFIILDLFLFNDDYDRKLDFPQISKTLTDTLIEQKDKYPDLKIIFITDEINNFYGAYKFKFIEQLKENDIEVIITDSTKTRDSNPLYSGVWRTFFRWFGTSGKGLMKNAFSPDSPKVTLRSYLKLLNFKANHRKVVITEESAIISSSNPHDASCYHSNIAFKVKGDIIDDLIQSELAVARFSGSEFKDLKLKYRGDIKEPLEATRLALITEGKIRKNLQEEIENTKVYDKITMGMFYLSDRFIVEELIRAANRGVDVKLVLDSNKDAFGIEKNGIPNRPVSAELVKKTNGKIKIRWYQTHGEQYHAKLAFIEKDDQTIIIGGSANLTKRNIGDHNLETDIKIEVKNDNKLALEIGQYFDRIWQNKDGHYTVDFSEFKEDGFLRNIIYRIQEFTGLGTF